jgi:adenosylmethionine-8-amino-7-oxononanoate aminotransferase
LAATLTTERVYRGFLGPYASQRTFFHGHSYTGNPLACAAGLESLKIFRRERVLWKLKAKIRLFQEELKRFEELPRVGEVRQRGLVAGIELVKDKRTKAPYPWEAQMGVRVCRYLRGRGILLRPLGNVVVLLPPLAISAGDLRRLCRETYAAIREVTLKRVPG